MNLSSAPTTLSAVDTELEPLAPGILGAFAPLDATTIVGYAFAQERLSQRIVVELILDGVPTQLARADRFHSGLHKLGIGDGCYGFHLTVPQDQLLLARAVNVRVANSHEALGQDPTIPLASAFSNASPGGVEWIGALHFRGWVPINAERPVITVKVDGEAVAETTADSWTLTKVDGTTRPTFGFHVQLPEGLADGRLHRATFEVDGQLLQGSPLPFIAYMDGLRQAIEAHAILPGDHERAVLFDALLPRVRPFQHYQAWAKTVLTASPLGSEAASASLLIGVMVLGDPGSGDTIDSLSHDTSPWIGAVLESDADQTGFRAEELSTFLANDGHDCEAFVFAPASIKLQVGALDRIRAALAAAPAALAVACDLDVEEYDGTRWPLAFPVNDYERTLEQGYWGRLFAVRRKLVEDAAAAGITNVFRLANSVFDGGWRGDRLSHLPGAVGTLPARLLTLGSEALRAATAAHLATLRQPVQLARSSPGTLPRVRVTRTARYDNVTVIIDTVANPMTSRVLRALDAQRRSRQVHLILLVSEPVGPHELPLAALPQDSSVLSVPPGGWATAVNDAFSRAPQGAACFIGSGLLPDGDDWLDELLSRLAGSDVGAVSPIIRNETGGVAQAGLVLGPRLDAIPAFGGRGRDDPGYGDLLTVAHEVGALDGRCFAIQTSVWSSVGGLDTLRFPNFLHGVDLSLRLRQAGLRLVLTPYAIARDFTAPLDPAALSSQRQRELQALRARWAEAFSDDPFYSPMLAHDGVPYGGLAWPAPQLTPRQLVAPKAAMFPPGL